MITSLLLVSSWALSCSAEWYDQLARELPVLGHRNWIVIADSAYPSQTAVGIKTQYVGGDQISAVKHVLEAIDQAKHIAPVIYLDKELKYVSEEDANGIGEFRKQLKEVLGDRKVNFTPHEQIIEQLDEAGQKFHVVIIKTDLTIPYTSVFIRLDAGYWSSESEAKLRKAMQVKGN